MSLVGDDLRGIHNPKVGGSSPPAATNTIKHLRAGAVPALFLFWRNSAAPESATGCQIVEASKTDDASSINFERVADEERQPF